MAKEKKVTSRIQHKHDTYRNWGQAEGFIPRAGELIIYDPDETCDKVGLKIGDGETDVTLLEFFSTSSQMSWNDF